MNTVKLSPSVVLLGAAQVLRRVGWGRQSMRDYQGRRCLMGAILHFINVNTETEDAEVAAAYRNSVQKLQNHLGGVAVWAWNDHKCISRQHAIETLEAAAGVK